MLDAFFKGYVESLCWLTEVDEEDLTDDERKRILSACEKFWASCGELVIDANYNKTLCGHGVAEQAGHDAYLTAVGSGAGFNDGDWDDQAAKKLTAAVYSMGEAVTPSAMLPVEITFDSVLADYFREEDEEDVVEESMYRWSEGLDHVGANYQIVGDCEISWQMTVRQALEAMQVFGWFRHMDDPTPLGLLRMLEDEDVDSWSDEDLKRGVEEMTTLMSRFANGDDGSTQA